MRITGMWRRLFAATLLLGILGAAPPANSGLAALHYLVGTWTCTYDGGGQPIHYQTKFAYDLGGSWLRERDRFADGGSDEETLTYDTKHVMWTAIIIDSPGTTTLFRASGSNPQHIVYHSVYPDASMTEAFDRVSATRFTIHFAQKVAGKLMKSSDICIKP